MSIHRNVANFTPIKKYLKLLLTIKDEVYEERKYFKTQFSVICINVQKIRCIATLQTPKLYLLCLEIRKV